MDVGSQPGNSIEIIEDYISCNFPGDARYMHAPLLGSMCKFPPGHRIRIERFVQELCTNRLPSMACHDIPYHGDAAVATKKRKGIAGLPRSTAKLTTRWRESNHY